MILCRNEFAKLIDKAVFPGTQGGPLMHVIAAKAVAFKEALADSFKEYQQRILQNAQALANTFLASGFTLVSGGTDTHLMLLDLRNRGLTGKAAECALDEVGITVNKNTIPFDPQSPFVTSGIRIGTPAVTTRGMGEAEMQEIGTIIGKLLSNINDDTVREEVRLRVQSLCQKFPLYKD